MFPQALLDDAETLIAELRRRGLRIVTAESCTGGLVAGLLTECASCSDVVDRGFVTYTNDAKMDVLNVSPPLLDAVGAVSKEVAIAMALGALIKSAADVSVAVTGVAGPAGGTAMKPVGLVHLAATRLGGPTVHQECRFGSLGRSEIRLRATAAALALVRVAIDQPDDQRMG